MTIEWNVVVQIAEPVILLFIGGWVHRLFENRPVLISYFSHVSAFRHTPSGGQLTQVNTHSVVLRNAGRQSATNVRIHHGILPGFYIFPAIVHNVETLPDGSQDIVIPTLVPGEQITISYLYFPPVTYEQVNAGIKSDRGFAKQIPVLIQRQLPHWYINILMVLLLVGAITVLYILYEVINFWLMR